MLIDWFTVIAQVVNFLVLMWLLKRFLYKPILNALDAREAGIAAEVKKAADEKAAAEQEHAFFRSKNETFTMEKSQLLAAAQEEAREEGRRLLEKERAAADEARGKWRDALAGEQRRFGEEVSLRVRTEVFAVLRQAFGDLADETLESRMTEAFCRRLRESREKLGDMAGESAFLVKTAFDLRADQQGMIRQALSDALGRDAEVSFQTEANLVSGVELVAGGHKVVWTLENFLGRLEGGIAELVEDKR